jgi:hypothetical protein
VPTPDITFQLLDGTQAAAHADELQALHAEVYDDPPYRLNDDAAPFADRFRVQRRQPGFIFAEARHVDSDSEKIGHQAAPDQSNCQPRGGEHPSQSPRNSSGPGLIFGIGDQVAPLGFRSLAFAGAFPHGEVGHEMIRGGAVPVPLARRRVDGIAGPDLGDLAAAGPDQPDSLGDVQGLPAGMRVPRVAGARPEPHLLASWSATIDQAETAHATDGA